MQDCKSNILLNLTPPAQIETEILLIKKNYFFLKFQNDQRKFLELLRKKVFLIKDCSEKLEIALNNFCVFTPHYKEQIMEAQFESIPLIDRLPKHLKQFIKPEDYSDYSSINQAVWRYVMRNKFNFFFFLVIILYFSNF